MNTLTAQQRKLANQLLHKRRLPEMNLGIKNNFFCTTLRTMGSSILRPARELNAKEDLFDEQVVQVLTHAYLDFICLELQGGERDFREIEYVGENSQVVVKALKGVRERMEALCELKKDTRALDAFIFEYLQDMRKVTGCVFDEETVTQYALAENARAMYNETAKQTTEILTAVPEGARYAKDLKNIVL